MPNVSDGRGSSPPTSYGAPARVLTGVVDGALSSPRTGCGGGHVGAWPRTIWRKCTLLMAASLSGNDMIAWLLEHRASVDLVDSQGALWPRA